MGGHVLFETGIRRLGSKDNGFSYRYPATGETVREERVLSRIEDLKVPPAWEEARIARSPQAKVQAVGYDSAGSCSTSTVRNTGSTRSRRSSSAYSASPTRCPR